MPINQLAQAPGQYKRGRSYFDNLNFASGNEQIQGAAADAGVPTSIGNPHADGLD
jgi:hypothetical protein